MRLAAITFAIAAPLVAQQSLHTYTYDVNGNPVAGPALNVLKHDGVVETTERMQSVNGRSLPLEKVVERVLRDDAQGKVIERHIVPYDREGRPGPPELVRIEETKRQDGGLVVRTTTLRGDINGRMRVTERSLAATTPTADGSATEIAIERPSVDGALETAERRTVTARKTGDVQNWDTVVYRRDGNGRFLEAARETREKQEREGGSVESTARYERRGEGAMQLWEQTVRRTRKDADGSQSAQVDVFRQTLPGVASDPSAPPGLIERQLIERRPSDGGFVESLSVQRPSMADPSLLGPPSQIAETVCRGKCDGT